MARFIVSHASHQKKEPYDEFLFAFNLSHHLKNASDKGLRNHFLVGDSESNYKATVLLRGKHDRRRDT